MNRFDLEQTIIRKASEDSAFRQRLLKDPRKTVESVLGVDLPPDMEIHVLEETPSKFYLVLPCPEDELSDADLERAAGGTLEGLRDAVAKIDGEIHKIK